MLKSKTSIRMKTKQKHDNSDKKKAWSYLAPENRTRSSKGQQLGRGQMRLHVREDVPVMRAVQQ